MALNIVKCFYSQAGDEVCSQQVVAKVCRHSVIPIVAIQPWGIRRLACLSAFVLEAPVVEALLNARASVEIRNREGLLPTDIALPATWTTWAGGAKHMRVTAGLVKYVIGEAR